MKRLILIIVAMFAFGSSFAQHPDRTVMEAQIAYDEAVLAYKHAVTDMRNEERRIIEATEHRLEEQKSDLEAMGSISLSQGGAIIIMQTEKVVYMGNFLLTLRLISASLHLKVYGRAIKN